MPTKKKRGGKKAATGKKPLKEEEAHLAQLQQRLLVMLADTQAMEALEAGLRKRLQGSDWEQALHAATVAAVEESKTTTTPITVHGLITAAHAAAPVDSVPQDQIDATASHLHRHILAIEHAIAAIPTVISEQTQQQQQQQPMDTSAD
jgi:hypothetical protein